MIDVTAYRQYGTKAVNTYDIVGDFQRIFGGRHWFRVEGFHRGKQWGTNLRERSFEVADPTTRNCLPETVRADSDKTAFKRVLKTEFFKWFN